MAATSGSAGWDRGCWSRRSSFAGSRDTNRFRRSSENWKLWHRLSWGLSNGERRRRVDYAGVATFNGVPGILPSDIGTSTKHANAWEYWVFQKEPPRNHNGLMHVVLVTLDSLGPSVYLIFGLVLIFG